MVLHLAQGCPIVNMKLKEHVWDELLGFTKQMIKINI